MSFSGILSYFEDIVNQNPHLAKDDTVVEATEHTGDGEDPDDFKRRKKVKKNSNKKGKNTS